MEQRRQSRFQVELAITLRSESQFWVGRTMNLSEGGIFVETQELKPIGTEVEVTITLPDPLLPLWAVGVVRWIRATSALAEAPLGMGLQFKLISDEALRTIRGFLWKRPPLQVDE
jgi:uncharacterized protein (TIGR02266 family)